MRHTWVFKIMYLYRRSANEHGRKQEENAKVKSVEVEMQDEVKQA